MFFLGQSALVPPNILDLPFYHRRDLLKDQRTGLRNSIWAHWNSGKIKKNGISFPEGAFINRSVTGRQLILAFVVSSVRANMASEINHLSNIIFGNIDAGSGYPANKQRLQKPHSKRNDKNQPKLTKIGQNWKKIKITLPVSLLLQEWVALRFGGSCNSDITLPPINTEKL